ncbi:MAG: hypothetical protein ACX98W_07485 [bacterium]
MSARTILTLSTLLVAMMAISPSFAIGGAPLDLDRAPRSASERNVPDLSDREVALARLDSRVDVLRREIGPGPRVGAVKKSRVRKEIREIRSVMQDLEAGARPDPQQIARLLDVQLAPERLSPEQLAERADQRRAVKERRLIAGPRIGALQRSRIRSELAKLDDIIADLEAGREIELARVDDLLGVRAPRRPLTPAEKLRSLEIQRATLKRKIGPGPRIGMVERTRIRDEIEAVDAMISELERRVDQQGR